LSGHSDSDVLAHAVVDALLGAAGLGDIGHLFPPTDERYRGADSMGFVSETATVLTRGGWRVSNLDATIIAEEPRLAPHIPVMRETLARALGISPAQVSVKGKSTNGLGFEGHKEGIAAQAVVLIEKTDA
jgi:2-C-methyl-D-erythritol 2,4-cyclodiphosphate synthase